MFQKAATLESPKKKIGAAKPPFPNRGLSRQDVDHPASARDPSCRFGLANPQVYRRRRKFVFANTLAAIPQAIPYDMFEVEFSDHADCCTFETMIERFGILGPSGFANRRAYP
jgi:chromate resistance exported protein